MGETANCIYPLVLSTRQERPSPLSPSSLGMWPWRTAFAAAAAAVILGVVVAIATTTTGRRTVSLPADSHTPSNANALVTGYGANDNCPPGAAIAYPGRRTQAGGSGSYEDPTTLAAAPDALTLGTIVYVDHLRRYFIFEDFCQECVSDWDSSRALHIDLWLGGAAVTPGSGLIECEIAITRASAIVVLNAPPGLPVDTAPIYDGTTCAYPTTHCVSQGNACGNLCQIPEAGTCDATARLLLMTNAHFGELNADLDCSRTLSAGTSVCMGGTCGG